MPQRAEQLFHKTILCVVLPVLCQCQCRAIRMPQHFKSYQLKGRAKIAKLLLAMLATIKDRIGCRGKAEDSFGSHTGLHCVHEFCCSSRWKTLRDTGEKAELTERLRPVFYIRNHTQRLFSCIRIETNVKNIEVLFFGIEAQCAYCAANGKTWAQKRPVGPHMANAIDAIPRYPNAIIWFIGSRLTQSNTVLD